MSNTTKKVSTKGVRYTDAQKKEVVDFVENYNTVNGRGGQSKAAEKFGISPLTVGAWLKAAGVKSSPKTAVKKVVKKAAPSTPKAAKATTTATPTVSGDISAKLSELLALSKEIVSAEAQLAKLQAKFDSLKGSL